MRDVVTDVEEAASFNKIQLAVRLFDGMPMGEPVEVFAVQFRGARLKEIELRQAFEALLLNRPYMMNVSRGSTHWGGAGESLTLLADIGNGVAASAVWDGLKALGRRFANNDYKHTPPDDQEAYGHAAMLVSERYAVEYDKLMPLSVEVRSIDGSAAVEIGVSGSAETYEVGLEVTDGLLVCVRIKHRFGSA